MARKVDKPASQPSAPSGADASAAAELDVLFPERMVPVAGEQLLVNEITFLDSLRLQSAVAPIVKAIEEAMLGGQVPGYDLVVGVLGSHWKATLLLLQATTGKSADWFDTLTALDGELLLLTFWNVNAGFFYQRATNAVAVRQETNRLLAGESSSPPSAPTATPPPTAGATPPGS